MSEISDELIATAEGITDSMFGVMKSHDAVTAMAAATMIVEDQVKRAAEEGDQLALRLFIGWMEVMSARYGILSCEDRKVTH